MDKHEEDLKLLSVQSVKVLLCAVIDTRWRRRQSCTTAAQSGILTSRVNSGIVRWHHHSICRFALSAIQPPALQHTWTWCILDDAIPHWKISFDCEFIHTGCKIIELVKSFKIFQSIFVLKLIASSWSQTENRGECLFFPIGAIMIQKWHLKPNVERFQRRRPLMRWILIRAGFDWNPTTSWSKKVFPPPAHIRRWGRTSPAPPTTPITQPNPSNFFLCPS